MSISLTLTPNGRATVNDTGRFLYLRHASHPIAVQLVSDLEQGHAVDIQLRRGELYDIGEQDNTVRFTRLELTNLSAKDNPVTLDVGFHRFRPSIDHSDINASITAVNVDVPVKLVEQATVSQVVEPVTVDTVTQPITVNQINQAVKTVPGRRRTRLNDLGINTFNQANRTFGLATYYEFVIARNDKRAELILTGYKGNVAPVMVHGIPIWSQETKGFEVTEDVTVRGKYGEKVYVSEILYVD